MCFRDSSEPKMVLQAVLIEAFPYGDIADRIGLTIDTIHLTSYFPMLQMEGISQDTFDRYVRKHHARP